jgi:AmmeMemoRadiSam system protein A
MSVHPLVVLAADSIVTFLTERLLIQPPQTLVATMPETARRGASFVCLKIDGRLRGCIGTVHPVYDCLALEVIHNAVAAATRDPRFGPVQISETDRLCITVDVLGAPEAIRGPEHLEPERFGIFVRSGPRQGVLLPGIGGIRTAEEQLATACEKAGIGLDEPMELYRFLVTRYR